ncbi:EAL domain-containing protein [Pseudofrankia inefficax]|uniref:Diguanylate cyclase/phosphodiesterase with GAF sensor n=1 Tax=Pseudofrankia inefficax (strain DSM 45817 / CECT 9037 / DDB 130130 / EuI1c) TaxID=298654 RepID=E3J1U7_PSEI1|nr:EAL domain-containing protein [Pseudofrankia inefficax]ADP82905.1 diguanylate cyclase/phosphodiesterase with GAF sensor [Pseudofrankia inefficax]
MRAMRAAVQRSGYLVALPLVGTLFLIVMLVAPSDVQMLPATFAALVVSAATLAYLLLDRRHDVRRQALVVSLTMTAAMTTAILGGDGSRAPLAFLLWFPWAGSYAGLVSSRRGPAVAVTGVICAALTVAMTIRGGLTAIPLTYVSCLLSTIGAAAFASGFLGWGRGQAFNDPLTGLTNRAGMMHAAEPAIAEMLLAGRSAILMVLDVNRFREINTALGHQAGDEALREFADLLRRVSPTPLFVGRLGGDEFVLVLPGKVLTTEDDDERRDRLGRLGREVLDQLDGLVRIRGIDVELESTAGLAAAPRNGDRLSALLPCADAALANAKRDGARVGVWTSGMAGTVGVRSWELALHAQLRRAIANRELVLYYQPLQDAATGRVSGVEALVRWCHPERGLLPPGSFLPMAERSTLIIDLTWWELDEALGQCAAWVREGLHIPVSANLSARMLVVDDLPRLITRRLEAYDLPPDMLTLEITESALISQPARAATMLGELRTAGVKLALDDFGTGYSSMEILKALPFDEMKIDKGFVADARGSLPDVAIVRSVIDLGHRLGLRVVGEGVEDEESARMLIELGVDLLQGDALSPPLPADELAALLRGGYRPVAASGEEAEAAPDLTAPAEAPPAVAMPAVAMPAVAMPETERPTGEEEVESPAAAARKAARLVVPDETTELWVKTGMTAPNPPDETERLAALHRYRILDTPPEPEFDALAALAAQVTDCRYGYLVFIDVNREWFKAVHGVELTDLGARVGPGSYIVASGEFLEIADTTRDLRYAHLARIEPAHVIFVAGAPLRTSEGRVLGALSVSDRVPRRLTSAQRAALQELAAHTMRLLDARLERLLLKEVEAGLDRLDRFWHRQDLTAAAAAFADTVRSLCGADTAAVMLPDLPGSSVFRVTGLSVAEGARPVSAVGMRTTLEAEEVVRQVAGSRRPVFVPDAQASTVLSSSMARKMEVASALMVPLMGEGGAQGLVAVRWVRPMRRLDPDVLRAVTLFTRQGRYTLERLLTAAGKAAGPAPHTGPASPDSPASPNGHGGPRGSSRGSAAVLGGRADTASASGPSARPCTAGPDSPGDDDRSHLGSTRGDGRVGGDHDGRPARRPRPADTTHRAR